MYNAERYDCYFDEESLGGREIQWDEEGRSCQLVVPASNHESPADAIYDIMEQLYNSANSIDVTKLQRDFSYLCERYGLSKELIEHKDGICVVHWREALGSRR